MKYGQTVRMLSGKGLKLSSQPIVKQAFQFNLDLWTLDGTSSIKAISRAWNVGITPEEKSLSSY